MGSGRTPRSLSVRTIKVRADCGVAVGSDFNTGDILFKFCEHHVLTRHQLEMYVSRYRIEKQCNVSIAIERIDWHWAAHITGHDIEQIGGESAAGARMTCTLGFPQDASFAGVHADVIAVRAVPTKHIRSTQPLQVSRTQRVKRAS